MSTTSTTEEAHDPVEHEGPIHPSVRQYVMIGLTLGVLTAIEVGLYYFEIGALNNAVLILLAIGKFALVAMYFMHLKYDRPILRRLFVTGVVLAIAVYMVYLMTLGVYVPES